MGKCLFMRKGETHTAPVNYKANFADNTWEQIIDACQKNAVPETWLVGDQKTMTLQGAEFAIDIIGKNHDDYSDENGKAPLTFQIHKCLTTGSINDTNGVGWENCNMRTTTLPSLLSEMPSSVKNAIKAVNKKTSAGNNSSSIITTSDKLFLLSEIEVFGTATNSFSGEGSQYDYYKSGNGTSKDYNDSASYWWLRSPVKGSVASFCSVSTDGNSTETNLASYRGVSFAFCF